MLSLCPISCVCQRGTFNGLDDFFRFQFHEVVARAVGNVAQGFSPARGSPEGLRYGLNSYDP
jgi:hypothetical protein